MSYDPQQLRDAMRGIIARQTVPHNNDTVEYGVTVFGYLMPRGVPFTGLEFAERIRTIADTTEPRIAAICAALEQHPRRLQIG